MKREIESPDQRNLFDGPQQVDYFRLAVLVRSMRLWHETGIIPTRGVGRNRMIEIAKEYTGNHYPKSRRGLELAHADCIEILNAADARKEIQL